MKWSQSSIRKSVKCEALWAKSFFGEKFSLMRESYVNISGTTARKLFPSGEFKLNALEGRVIKRLYWRK